MVAVPCTTHASGAEVIPESHDSKDTLLITLASDSRIRYTLFIGEPRGVAVSISKRFPPRAAVSMPFVSEISRFKVEVAMLATVFHAADLRRSPAESGEEVERIPVIVMGAPPMIENGVHDAEPEQEAVVVATDFSPAVPAPYR